jgi:hypothetical protein
MASVTTGLSELITRFLGELSLGAPGASLEHYIVRFGNMTSVPFDEVVIFYKRRWLPGVVFLDKIGLIPGEVTDFDLGICQFMESYVIGVFIGSDLVAQLPAPGDGNITPERASQIDSADIDPCVDSWNIWDA